MADEPEGPSSPSSTRQTEGTELLLSDAARRAVRYLGEIADRPVAPTGPALAALDRLGGPLPEAGRAAREVLELLDTFGSPATVASAGPRYFGFVIGGAYPVAVATAWLMAAWDQDAALRVMSPVAAHLDEIALDWAVDLLGLPPGTGGGFVTGATMANATCLAAARDSVLAAAGWDSARLGLIGAPPVQVVIGDEAHTTVVKALGLVGLGRGSAVKLPVDEQGRIVPRDLPVLRPPAIVCLQAGNVNSGASDPFVPLVDWAHSYGAWAHVDGAFGLWAAAAPDVAGQVAGAENADSWATDAHKWLNTTYDSGIALVKKPDALARAMEATAPYLVPGAGREPMHYTPQSSQRARGVECWAVLSHLGRQGVSDLVSRSCRLARRFADHLRQAGFEILNDVVLNQVVVAFGDQQRTDDVMSALQAEGTCWCGSTTWRDRRAMRISVSNWSTTEADIDRSAAAVLRAAGS